MIEVWHTAKMYIISNACGVHTVGRLPGRITRAIINSWPGQIMLKCII
jgi:hypothetical protein